MFRTIISSAIATSFLLVASTNLATANEGGGGGDGAIDQTFITMTNPDGSTVTGRYGRKKSRAVRVTTKRNRAGRKVKVIKRKKTYTARNGKKRSRPWAHNHTTGVTSVGIRPGVRVVIGRGVGIQFSF